MYLILFIRQWKKLSSPWFLRTTYPLKFSFLSFSSVNYRINTSALFLLFPFTFKNRNEIFGFFYSNELIKNRNRQSNREKKMRKMKTTRRNRCDWVRMSRKSWISSWSKEKEKKTWCWEQIKQRFSLSRWPRRIFRCFSSMLICRRYFRMCFF